MTAHSNSGPSAPILRWARLAAGTAIAATAALVASTAATAPPGATASSPTAHATPAAQSTETGPADLRTEWRTRDPREGGADYGDVRRLRIVREGRQLRIRMQYWEGPNKYNPDLLHVEVDTGGSARPEFDIYYDSALARRLRVYRYEGRLVCGLTIEDKPRYGFNQQVPLRCLTTSGTGRPARARFRVLNSPEDPNFGASEIVPGGVWRGGAKVRGFGPWLVFET